MKKKGFFAAGLLVLGLILAACGSTGGGSVPQKDSAVDQNRIEHYGEEIQRLIENGVPITIIELQLQNWLANNSLTQAEYQQLVNESKSKTQEWQAGAAERQAKAEAEQQAKEEAARKAEEERRALAERQEQERQAALAAANAKGVSAEDFEYDITEDGTGIVIKRYKGGLATIINVPALIEGLPVKEIGSYGNTYTTGAFQGNTSITSITLPDSVTALNGVTRDRYSGDKDKPVGAFEGCTGLTSITLSRNLKTIDRRTFSGCTSLTEIVIPAGISVIGPQAFEGCTRLAAVSLPAGITTIDRFAFRGCTGLGSITLPDSLTSIGAGAFMKTGLTSVVLPRNLRTMEGSFSDDDDIYTEYGIGWIYGGVFRECTQLESVTIEGSGVSLVRTFEGCRSLTTLTINGNITLEDNPGSEEKYDGSVFPRCFSLTTVNIGPKVTKIDNVDQLINAGKLSIASKAALARLR